MSNTAPPLANSCLIVSPDGFLWYGGMKLPCKLVAGGLEFYEKDPRRAAACGGPLFVVPFDALLRLATARGVVFNQAVIEVRIPDGEGD